MKVIGYIAKSQLSLEVQRRIIAGAAEREGWEILSIIEERSEAASLDRAGLRAAVQCLQGEAELIICAQVQVLADGLIQWVRWCDRLPVDQVYICDLQGRLGEPNIELVANIMVITAQRVESG